MSSLHVHSAHGLRRFEVPRVTPPDGKGYRPDVSSVRRNQIRKTDTVSWEDFRIGNLRM